MKHTSTSLGRAAAWIPSHGNPFARRFLPPPQPRRPHTALLTSPSLAPPPTPGKGRRKDPLPEARSSLPASPPKAPFSAHQPQYTTTPKTYVHSAPAYASDPKTYTTSHPKYVSVTKAYRKPEPAYHSTPRPAITQKAYTTASPRYSTTPSNRAAATNNRGSPTPSYPKTMAPFKKPAITFYSNEDVDDYAESDGAPLSAPTDSLSPSKYQQQQYDVHRPINPSDYYASYLPQYYHNYYPGSSIFHVNPPVTSRAFFGPNVDNTAHTGLNAALLPHTREQLEYLSPKTQYNDKTAYYPQEILRRYYLDSFTHLSGFRRNNSHLYSENPYTRKYLGVTPAYMTTAGPDAPKPLGSFTEKDSYPTNPRVRLPSTPVPAINKLTSPFPNTSQKSDSIVQRPPYSRDRESNSQHVHTASALKESDTPKPEHPLQQQKDQRQNITQDIEVTSLPTPLSSSDNIPTSQFIKDVSSTIVSSSLPEGKSLLDLYPFKKPKPRPYINSKSQQKSQITLTTALPEYGSQESVFGERTNPREKDEEPHSSLSFSDIYDDTKSLITTSELTDNGKQENEDQKSHSKSSFSTTSPDDVSQAILPVIPEGSISIKAHAESLEKPKISSGILRSTRIPLQKNIDVKATKLPKRRRRPFNRQRRPTRRRPTLSNKTPPSTLSSLTPQTAIPRSSPSPSPSQTPSLIHTTYLPSSPSPPPTRRRVVMRKRRPSRPHPSQRNLSSLRSKNLRPILRKRRPRPPPSTPTSPLSVSPLVSITSALPKASSITGDITETAFSSESHETYGDSEKPALSHHEKYAASLTSSTSLTHLPTSSIPPTSSSNIPNDGILSTTPSKPSGTSSRSPTSSSITITPSIEVSPHGFPNHELHHPVSSSTTLAPTGEKSLHSRLPIPTGGNKSFNGLLPGYPRPTTRDPTGVYATGPNLTVTAPTYTKQTSHYTHPYTSSSNVSVTSAVSPHRVVASSRPLVYQKSESPSLGYNHALLPSPAPSYKAQPPPLTVPLHQHNQDFPHHHRFPVDTLREPRHQRRRKFRFPMRRRRRNRFLASRFDRFRNPHLPADTLHPTVQPKVPIIHLTTEPVPHGGRSKYQLQDSEEDDYTVIHVNTHHEEHNNHPPTHHPVEPKHDTPPIHKIHGYLPSSSPHYKGNDNNPVLKSHPVSHPSPHPYKGPDHPHPLQQTHISHHLTVKHDSPHKNYSAPTTKTSISHAKKSMQDIRFLMNNHIMRITWFITIMKKQIYLALERCTTPYLISPTQQTHPLSITTPLIPHLCQSM
ncbi:hypothetical protein C7M84_019403 [Penaeus vannamei]|uniref:Uncharacterized protein n=1 Tax=Penaeus vannamei TaxID=6689 RepID=A0A423SEV5_PENVA|nr:hypothetical protein C7M84_019403 [Penaeus vannamei]